MSNELKAKYLTDITLERLKGLLSYDQDTGLFTWKENHDQ